jgi:hypothetical protein
MTELGSGNPLGVDKTAIGDDPVGKRAALGELCKRLPELEQSASKVVVTAK